MSALGALCDGLARLDLRERPEVTDALVGRLNELPSVARGAGRELGRSYCR